MDTDEITSWRTEHRYTMSGDTWGVVGSVTVKWGYGLGEEGGVSLLSSYMLITSSPCTACYMFILVLPSNINTLLKIRD